MSTAAEVADFGKTDQLSATESTVHDDAGTGLRAVYNGDVADDSADAIRNRNPVRHRVLKTMCIYVSFLCMGMCIPLIGTTIVHMERLFDSDTATMSWTFTVMSLGYFFGAIACGFIYDHVNHELLLVIVNCVEVVSRTVLVCGLDIVTRNQFYRLYMRHGHWGLPSDLSLYVRSLLICHKQMLSKITTETHRLHPHLRLLVSQH